MIEERHHAPFIDFVHHDGIMLSSVGGPVFLVIWWLLENFTGFRISSSGNPLPIQVAGWGSVACLCVTAARASVVVGWWSNAHLVECSFVRRGLQRGEGCDVVVAFEFKGQPYEKKFTSSVNRVELMERYGTDLLVIDGRKPTRCDTVNMPLYKERFSDRQVD